MTRSTHQGPLLYFPEIEARLRRLNFLRRRKLAANSQLRERARRRSMVGMFQPNNQNSPPEEKMLRDYYIPEREESGSPLVYPDVAVDNFELKSGMIQWVQQSCSFHRLPNEGPNNHLKTFGRVCNTIMIRGLTEDDVKLRIFPFTLMDQAQV